MTEPLKRVIRYLNEENGTAILFTMSDPHGSEYPGDCDRWVRYMTGFTGSAGTLVVFADGECCFWTDGRYHIQAEQQLRGSGIRLFRQGLDGVPSPAAFLSDVLGAGDVLLLPEDYMTAWQYDMFGSALTGGGSDSVVDQSSCREGKPQIRGIELEGELSEMLWPDRPARKASPAWILRDELAGETMGSKVERVRLCMEQDGLDCIVVTAPDTICWLLNLRGHDIAYTPVLYSCLILRNQTGRLYLQGPTAESLPGDYIDALSRLGITVCDYEKFYSDLSEEEGTAGCDRSSVNHRVARICSASSCERPIHNDRMMPQSRKNPGQIRNIRRAHLQDGIALTKLICEIKTGGRRMSEWDVACLLEEKKRVWPDYLEPSFATIAAYGKNAAIVHYAPDAEHSSWLEPRGLLLLDCGGQYLGGTTDVTRTIALGPLSDDEKEYYTAVLKGHLRAMNAVIDPQTPTRRIDELARGPLWDLGADYLHGTGHGVGHILSVHEGPVRIVGARNLNAEDRPLERGNVVSIEPGYYREGEFGIRIDNLVSVERSAGRRFYLQPLTLAPYEPEAIVPERLSEQEKRWLNRYHQHVYETLAPHLTDRERRWLKEETAFY